MEKERAHRLFIARLERWDSEELFDAERAVRELLDHPGYAVLQELIGAVASRHEDQLRHGDADLPQATYAKTMGVIVGLEAQQAAAEAVLLRAEDVHRELERRAEPVPA